MFNKKHKKDFKLELHSIFEDKNRNKVPDMVEFHQPFGPPVSVKGLVYGNKHRRKHKGG